MLKVNSAHVNHMQNCSKAANVFMTIAEPIRNIKFDTDYVKWLLARQQELMRALEQCF